MSILAPLGLLALLALPVIIVLHMLRERRRRVVVPSLLLWQQLPQQRAARRRRRPPLTVLLLLHLLAAALLGFALARPQWSLASFGAERHLALVIDTSASMAAPAPGFSGSRLDAARARARTLIGSVGARGSTTLITAGPQARLLDAAGPEGAARLAAALAGLSASGAGSDMAGALTLAETALQGRAGGQIVVLTDAALPTLAAELGGRPVVVPIAWESLGGPLDNRALLTLAAHPRAGNGPVHVYARVANYGSQPLRTVVRLAGDERVLDSRAVNLQPDGEVELTWTVPRGMTLLRAELDGEDALPADDVVALSLVQNRPVRALLVAAQPTALERALRAVPGLDLELVSPADYRGSTADLTVFDGVLPPAWPAGGVLVVHPPAGSPLLSVSATPRTPAEPALSVSPAGSALFDGVSLNTVEFGAAPDLAPPERAAVLLARGDQPLIASWRSETSTIAVWSFDLAQSNLTTRLAFPLLVARTVRELTPPAPPAALLAGAVVELRPDPRATTLELTAPDGAITRIAVTPGAPARFNPDQPGIYTLAERAGARLLYEGRIAVNAGAAFESDLRPQSLPGPVAPPALSGTEGAANRPLWPWLAAVALLVMLGEWFYVHGRRAPGLAEG